MAARYQVSLAHQGCIHTGSVVWEERARTDVDGQACAIVVSLPRGFVSLNANDGSIEIVCSGCTQTVASAAFSIAGQVEHAVIEAPEPDTVEHKVETEPTQAAPTAAPVLADDLERLFAEHPDVRPIPGGSIPHHLVDRLRHLASRLRGNLE